ncbi:DegQ family serine endoprotease [Thermodesulfobacteriota bacterium]
MDTVKKISVIVLLLTLALFAPYHLNSIPQVQATPTGTISVPDSFHHLAEKVSPAVVNIRTVKTINGGGPVFRHFQKNPFGKDDPFHDFFERFFGDQHQKEFKQRSLGSGFIIDKGGYIVTNNHVIENADQIEIKLNDGEEFEAEIVGRDPSTDLALLKIKSGRSLPYAEPGDSDKLKVGEWVVAIGSPFGLEHTVTAGIVSAKGRVIGSGPYDDFIQTDASINPGNSGGPLINMEGEVVGINTAIIAGGQGIGFAVPINAAKGIIEQLKTEGEVSRGWLGVAIQDVTEEMSEYYGLKSRKGAMVAQVFEDDPADQAGIKPGDIIIEVEGEKISSSRDLTRIIAGIGVGDTAKIIVLREGRTKTFKVKITKRKDDRIASRRDAVESEDELGIRVSNITPDTARRFNITDAQGIIVAEVKSGSKGLNAGVQAGDVIKEVNRQVIITVKDYESALKKVKKGKTIHLFIRRANVGFVVINLKK